MAGTQDRSILAFDEVTVRFDGRAVLDRVSFELHRGESLVLVGEAGSGKTVLLKSALGLIKADGGRIYLFGEDVTKAAEQQWYGLRARMGVLFQEGGLFDSLSIEDNVAYPLLNQASLRCPEEELARRVEQSLEFVELGHTLEKFPSELSGGMRRRVGIARAIVTEPDLLLYDSPTAGLDPITAATIMALIIKGRDVRRATTVIVTHRYQDGEMLTRYRHDASLGHVVPAAANGSGPRTHYVALREGRIVFDGSQSEMEAAADEYVANFVRRPG
ncbi:MAG: organic solvent resistance ABC transporter ATP-binding protein [Candidatus Solibacter sp.]|nr:organic solvent resistance ABC transporter ATP-binding protein [Candidatus Solibacter sp.]